MSSSLFIQLNPWKRKNNKAPKVATKRTQLDQWYWGRRGLKWTCVCSRLKLPNRRFHSRQIFNWQIEMKYIPPTTSDKHSKRTLTSSHTHLLFDPHANPPPLRFPSDLLQTFVSWVWKKRLQIFTCHSYFIFRTY